MARDPFEANFPPGGKRGGFIPDSKPKLGMAVWVGGALRDPDRILIIDEENNLNIRRVQSIDLIEGKVQRRKLSKVAGTIAQGDRVLGERSCVILEPEDSVASSSRTGVTRIVPKTRAVSGDNEAGSRGAQQFVDLLQPPLVPVFPVPLPGARFPK